MARTIVFGHDEKFARWACERIPWAPYHETMRAVAVTDGVDANSKCLAVCIFHNYRPPMMVDGKQWDNTVEITIYAPTPAWATRRIIRDLLRIPFTGYKVRKVRLTCPSTNKRAIRFAEGIGFTPEGTLRHEFAKGVHACVLGLLRSEFEHPNFLRSKRRRGAKRRQPNGQIDSISAPASA